MHLQWRFSSDRFLQCHTGGIGLRHNERVKLCPVCGQVLPRASFSCPAKRPRGNSYCFDCQRAYSRAHYRRNRQKHNVRRYLNQRKYAELNRTRLREYLSRQACVDCGESDPRVLEFDHVRGQKVGNISEMVGEGWAWRRIALEIEKCEMRCANCHRRKTAVERSWWRASAGRSSAW